MWRLFLVLFVLLGVGCETAKRSGQPDTALADAGKRGAVDVDALIDEVQRLRDREFAAKPAIEVVDKLEPAVAPAPDDAEVLSKALFAGARLHGVVHPLEALASYDRESNTLRYVRGGDKDALERAIIFALARGLDAAQPPPAPQISWDGLLARRAAELAAPAFVTALFESGRRKHGLDAPMLARRPDVVASWPVFAPYLGNAKPEPSTELATLADREVAFAFREGLALAAALHRSAGWSGVESLAHELPGGTGHVVRADRWFNGEGLGKWGDRGESTDQPTRRGRIGPALTAMWLSRSIDARIARAIYVSWQSDTYRYYEIDGGWRFVWLSAWRTPHDAQQLSEALSAGFRGREEVQAHVVQNGVVVVAVIGTEAIPEEQLIELAKSSPTFPPASGPPIQFAPSAVDRLLASQQKVDFDGDRWADPELGFEVDAGKLGDAWTLQKTDEAHLRWFAKHSDGSLIELTTELSDPSGPEFSTKAYADRLASGFRKTLKSNDAAVERMRVSDRDVMVVTVTGQVEGVSRKLRVWHLPIGPDFVVTYSLQADPERFDAHVGVGQSVFETLRATGSEARKTSGPDSGVLEFKVED